MCGIVGIIGETKVEEARQLLSAMCDSIKHRGPDDAGIWHEGKVGFGMRRLSIIDIAGGHQPMWEEGGRGIVYNGEIYNYRPLKAELEKRGHSFRTQSDTEVILRLFADRGLEGIRELQGMFAICLYDPVEGNIHLIRDRVGIKPLYYAQIGDRFYFASELRAILRALESRPDIDAQALYDYLTLRYVAGPRTIWRGIRSLEPGHILTLNLETNDLQTTRFWDFRIHSDTLDDGRDYLSEFEDLFLKTVESHIEASDVPVGAMLSGGLDSSAVCAAAYELGHRKIHTFSYATKGAGEQGELHFAKEVAEHLGTHHHVVELTGAQFVDSLDEFIEGMEQPYRDLTGVPLLHLSRCASEHVKVVMSGEGADELLAGYTTDRISDEERMLRKKFGTAPRALYALAAGLAPRGYRRLLWSLARSGWRGYPEGKPNYISYYFGETDKSRVWQGPPVSSTDDLIASFYARNDSPHILDRIQEAQCRSWLVEDLLMKADKMSMAASVELRVPFLDHELFEWCARAPMEMKHRVRPDGTVSAKHVLREFASSRLPMSIIDRRKEGFPISETDILRDNFDKLTDELLTDSNSATRDWIDIDALAPMFDEARAGNVDALDNVFLLVVLERWLRVWR